MKILISAAEASSDLHGAELLKALRARASVEAFGIGGPKLQAAGLRQIVDARSLLAMGFAEVLGRLPKIFRALKLIEGSVRSEKPDVAVFIDYPDFHFRLARRLQNQGVPLVYYIPPKVWVWRQHRVAVLRELFSKVLCIFPFEEEFFRKASLDVRYVGNPLLDELPLNLTRDQARRELGLTSQERAVLVMPGSRPSELKWHLELMLNAVTKVACRMNGLITVLMPFSTTTDMAEIQSSVETWLKGASTTAKTLKVRLFQGNAPICMAAADAGLVKSGTSTLEAAVMGCPHAVVYRTNALTAWIFKRLIRFRGPVGLVNLVGRDSESEPYPAKEILLDEATEENLANEAERLLREPQCAVAMKRLSEKLREKLKGPSLSPSAAAAEEILQLVRSSRGGS